MSIADFVSMLLLLFHLEPLDQYGQRVVATGRRRRPEHGAGLFDGPLREAFQYLFERDAALEPGERGAEAEVDTEREREDAGGFAVDIEPIAVGEATLIAVRRTHDAGDHSAGGDRAAREVHVLDRVAGVLHARRLVAEELLDRVRNEGRVLDELAALVGVVREDLAGPADQLRGGVVPRTRQER